MVNNWESDETVKADLQQKKKGLKFHPVKYVDKTNNYAERSYYPCEIEALAVIFALTKFWF